MTSLKRSPPVYPRPPSQHPRIVHGVHVTDAMGEYRRDVKCIALHRPYGMKCRSCGTPNSAAFLIGNEHSHYLGFCGQCATKFTVVLSNQATC